LYLARSPGGNGAIKPFAACYQCRKPFTVKIGTIFEASHVPMRHWLQAIFLMSPSKKGISSNQLHYPRLHPQNRLVHFASYPRGNARDRRWPNGSPSRPTQEQSRLGPQEHRA
jgi:hypothetical protein